MTLLDDYLHIQIPVPVLRTERLTATAKLVFGYVRSKQLMKKRPVRVLAEWLAIDVGASVRACEEALRSLVKVGLLTRQRARGRGRGKFAYATSWPAWLSREAGENGLTHEARRRLAGELDKRQVVRSGDNSRDRQDLPPNDEPAGSNYRDLPAESAPLPKSTSKEIYQESEPPREEETSLEARDGPGGGGGQLPPSGRRLKRQPSRRWEFSRWRDRPPTEWQATDLVGYWACRYREVHCEEDRELFSVDVAAKSRLLSSVDRHVREWMEGDFAAAKCAVDLILQHAEQEGMPVALRYFFLPTDEGPLPRLRRQIANARGGRPRSKSKLATEAERIREISNRDGADVARWRRVLDAQRKRRRGVV